MHSQKFAAKLQIIQFIKGGMEKSCLLLFVAFTCHFRIWRQRVTLETLQAFDQSNVFQFLISFFSQLFHHLFFYFFQRFWRLDTLHTFDQSDVKTKGEFHTVMLGMFHTHAMFSCHSCCCTKQYCPACKAAIMSMFRWEGERNAL